jgi:2-polyprenyl-3-methyl-5-hydroxy-6-metoxy-1,4-benzoquinol methylase
MAYADERIRTHLREFPADRDYVELLLRNDEFAPSDKKYRAWLNYNLSGITNGRRLIGRLEDKLGPIAGWSVLDVGAGGGGCAVAMARHGCRVTAVEIDPVRIPWLQARVRDHGVDVAVVTQPLEATPPEIEFDLVICSSVLEHVTDWQAFLGEILRRCRRAAFITWPNKLALTEIASDQHYGVPGASFLTGRLRFLQRPYIRLFGVHRNAWVVGIPTVGSVRRFLRRQPRSFSLERMVPEGAEKITDPRRINHPLARRALLALRAVGLPERWLLRLVIAQKAVHECLLRTDGVARRG